MVTQNMLRKHETDLFGENNPTSDSLHLIKSLKQIKQQRLLLTCAPISE